MYLLIILPLISVVVVEITKYLIPGNKRRLSLKNLFSYAGMPSGHAAVMVSLVTIVGLTDGVSSPLFAVTVILGLIIIRDAVGLRRYLGMHGKTLNVLVKDLKDDYVLDEHYPHLLETIGHTYVQVAVGAAIGFLVSIAGYYMMLQ